MHRTTNTTSAAGRLLLGPLAATVLLFGGLAGCKPPEYPACKKDKHCEDGEPCVDGVCQQCTTDEECKGKGDNGEDLSCVEMRCVLDPNAQTSTSPGELGDPCTSTDECVMGYVCRDGQCSLCESDGECPNGKCNLESGRCESACQTDDDCPTDEICDGGQCVFGGDYNNDEVLCGLEAVYFAFDSPKLSPKATEALEAAAECIKEQNREVILEAHADQLGTEEYNILLTDKRGQSVKKYLVNFGVPEHFMKVISKGSLEASGTTEGERAKDRRVQFLWQ